MRRSGHCGPQGGQSFQTWSARGRYPAKAAVCLLLFLHKRAQVADQKQRRPRLGILPDPVQHGLVTGERRDAGLDWRRDSLLRRLRAHRWLGLWQRLKTHLQHDLLVALHGEIVGIGLESVSSDEQIVLPAGQGDLYRIEDQSESRPAGRRQWTAASGWSRFENEGTAVGRQTKHDCSEQKQAGQHRAQCDDPAGSAATRAPLRSGIAPLPSIASRPRQPRPPTARGRRGSFRSSFATRFGKGVRHVRRPARASGSSSSRVTASNRAAVLEPKMGSGRYTFGRSRVQAE